MSGVVQLAVFSPWTINRTWSMIAIDATGNMWSAEGHRVVVIWGGYVTSYFIVYYMGVPPYHYGGVRVHPRQHPTV